MMERNWRMDPKRFFDINNILYTKRKEDSIKSDFGRSLIIAGSRRYPLCVIIASNCCFAAANGYTALSVVDSIYPSIVSRMNPTQIIEPLLNDKDSFLSSQDLTFLNKYDSILFGNGILETEENRKFLQNLLQVYQNHLIIDATGITLLSKDREILEKKNPKQKLLFTPHLREASRLMDIEEKGREPSAYLDDTISFCRKYHVNILLKSFKSIYVNEEGFYEESQYKPTVNLAKAGSGDGLSGYLCGILAYAPKKIGFDQSVIFADHMVHIASYQAYQELGITSSILDVPRYISMIAKGK